MKLVQSDIITQLSQKASQSWRRRSNYNFHPALDDPIQRMLNAIEPGSYIRPHRHAEADRWEWFQAITGEAVVLLFDDKGRVSARAEIRPDGPVYGIEIGGGAWHTIASLKSGTVLLEIKPGPYKPLEDKDFASWAPPEKDPLCTEYEACFHTIRVGQSPSHIVDAVE